jgi:excisionase family DNA binding protein
VPKHKSIAQLTTVNGKPVGRRYAKIVDAAIYLDVHPITIRAMIEAGKIHAYRSGQRLLRVDLNELDALMAGDTDSAGGVA